MFPSGTEVLVLDVPVLVVELEVTGGSLVVELLLVVGSLVVVLTGGGACVMLNAVSPMKVISGGLGGIWNM
jgi:hypothetical protein